MSAFICKQPNGKYCRFSTVVDTVTHINMTEDEYIAYRVEIAIRNAREELNNHLQPFDEIKKQFYPEYDTVEDFNKYLKEMGDTEQLDPEEYK